MTKVIVMTWWWEIISRQSGLGAEWSVKGDAMQDLLDCKIGGGNMGSGSDSEASIHNYDDSFFHSSKQDSPSDETNSPIKSR